LPNQINNDGSRVLKKSLDVKFDIKLDNSQEGVFTGYGSMFGNRDLDGDVIAYGAFSESLKSNEKIRLLWQHNTEKPIGVITKAVEDEIGLYIEGRLTMEVQEAREARALLRDGAIDSFSIGFGILEDEYDRNNNTRVIKKVVLYEVSIVTFPANPQARLQNIKAATPYMDLPLAERDMEWDSTEAIRRIRDFTNSQDAPSSDYKDAFFWYDENEPDLFGSYKLPFADVVDGELRAVPRGVFAANAAMAGARGGVDIPEDDREAVQRNIDRYRTKIDRETEEEQDSEKNKKLTPQAKAKLKVLEKAMTQAGLSRTEALDFVSKCKTVSGDLSDSGQDALLTVLGMQPALSDSKAVNKESDSFNEREVIEKLNDCLLNIKLNSINI